MERKNVFTSLRFKITFMVLIVLAVILSVLIGLMNLYLRGMNERDCREFVMELLGNDGNPIAKNRFEKEPPRDKGDMPPPKEPKSIYSLEYWLIGPSRSRGFRDYYAVKLDSNGNVIEVIRSFSADSELSVSDSFIAHALRRFSRNHGCGMHGDLAYGIESRDYGYLFVAVDRVNELGHQHNFMAFSVSVFLISLVIAFFVSLAVSSIVVKPVEEVFIKQKQFIADASHELKTPVAVISANIDVLEQEFPGNKWLGYIKTENERMGSLVKDMLYLAKDDAGKLEFEKCSFDLSEAAACSVLPFESVAFEQKKTLEIDTSKDVLPVLGDEAKIKQAIIVLVDNALKNSDEGALIKVTAGKEGNRCFVRVYNTGHGIPQGDLGKIFNRFFRSDTSRARSTGGYGLGLAIAKSIVSSHKGRISVESVENEYAMFTMTLPMTMP